VSAGRTSVLAGRSIAHARSLVMLTLARDTACAITRFGDNSLFPASGWPGPAALTGYLAQGCAAFLHFGREALAREPVP
jgi:hypothetical protein